MQLPGTSSTSLARLLLHVLVSVRLVLAAPQNNKSQYSHPVEINEAVPSLRAIVASCVQSWADLPTFVYTQAMFSSLYLQL